MPGEVYSASIFTSIIRAITSILRAVTSVAVGIAIEVLLLHESAQLVCLPGFWASSEFL